MSDDLKRATVRIGPTTMVNLPVGAEGAEPLEARQLVRNEFAMVPTEGFAGFLLDQKISLVTTTYHTGRLLLIGLNASKELIFTTRMFERAMGLCVTRDQLHLATSNTIWHFRNPLNAGQKLGDYDAMYSPRTCHVTGLLDIHDMIVEKDGRLVFVNTAFSCIATTADGYSFRPVWTPPWISRLVPEDRCHLNGLCARDGVARYVTAVARSDGKEQWRANRATSGVLWDIVENRAVLEGLCMPHSPRWINGQLYFLNAGTGYLCRADINSGKFEDVAFCSGFVRGMAVHGNHAFVGISDMRANRTFSDLPLEKNLKKHNTAPYCAILVINLSTGAIDHQLRFEGQINELYDVAVIEGVRQPQAIGFQRDEINYFVEIAN